MFYYTVKSSHWPMILEFKSMIPMEVDQCFRITSHDGSKRYPTRFKILSVSESPNYTGQIVEIQTVDLTVEPF
jgi:hypothetical protein